ncbi:hypothetical protein [Actinoplanes sp. GCM10030250]|uniref:hypothetical protein n=1 Tax=Actinoplanes sp. GCM10030250 TaxID=3273376 RepID=UPI00360A06EB
MITDLDPPAERDLPPARAARIRADLLAGIAAHERSHRPGRVRSALTALAQRPGHVGSAFTALSQRPGHVGSAFTALAQRPGRVRFALAAAVVLAAAGVTSATQLGPGDPPVTTIAMGPSELTPSLADTVRDCGARFPEEAALDKVHQALIDTGELAVALEHDGKATALFLGPDGYVTCDEVRAPFGASSSGFGADLWHGQRDWLPGPVQRLSVASSGLERGWAFAAGRVSYRVDRLVLEHGTGNRTEARLANGAFGLITATDDVQPDAQLIAYDAAGKVIEREPFFEPLSAPAQCYTDPSGKVIYSREVTPDRDCLPAEPWKR